MQNGSFEPGALAPIARLFGIGTVALRSDLAYERSGSPHPRVSSGTRSPIPDPPGIGAPTHVRTAARPTRRHRSTASTCGPSDVADPPPVALFPVRATPRRSCAPRPTATRWSLAGDGDGIVDSAAAGLAHRAGARARARVARRRRAAPRAPHRRRPRPHRLQPATRHVVLRVDPRHEEPDPARRARSRLGRRLRPADRLLRRPLRRDPHRRSRPAARG